MLSKAFEKLINHIASGAWYSGHSSIMHLNVSICSAHDHFSLNPACSLWSWPSTASHLWFRIIWQYTFPGTVSNITPLQLSQSGCLFGVANNGAIFPVIWNSTWHANLIAQAAHPLYYSFPPRFSSSLHSYHPCQLPCYSWGSLWPSNLLFTELISAYEKGLWGILSVHCHGWSRSVQNVSKIFCPSLLILTWSCHWFSLWSGRWFSCHCLWQHVWWVQPAFPSSIACCSAHCTCSPSPLWYMFGSMLIGWWNLPNVSDACFSFCWLGPKCGLPSNALLVSYSIQALHFLPPSFHLSLLPTSLWILVHYLQEQWTYCEAPFGTFFMHWVSEPVDVKQSWHMFILLVLLQFYLNFRSH